MHNKRNLKDKSIKMKNYFFLILVAFWKKFNVKDIELAYKLIPDYNKSYDQSKVSKDYGDDPKFERPKILMINNKYWKPP